MNSLREADFGGSEVTIWILENASTDESRSWLFENFGLPKETGSVERNDGKLSVRVEFADENLGFAGGNNFLWRRVQAELPETSHIYLLNQDTEVDGGFLREALNYMDCQPSAGCVQSLLLLHPEKHLINTAGNIAHYLGFGLTSHYRSELQSLSSSLSNCEIGYASGAAVLIDADMLRQVGLFEDWMFMYLEDADLGWKLRLAGRPPYVCGGSRVFHKYRFQKSFSYYEYLERNRLWLVLVYYKLGTLVLLVPAFLMMECGQLLFATSRGLLGKKFRSYAFFFKRCHASRLFAMRRAAQDRRRISDREFLRSMSGRIESPNLQHWLLRHFANPVLSAYLKFLKLTVWW